MIEGREARPQRDQRHEAGAKAPGGLCPGCNQSRLKIDRKTGLCARCLARGVKLGRAAKPPSPILKDEDWRCESCGVPVIVGSERCRLHLTYQPGVSPRWRPAKTKRRKPKGES